MAVDTNLQLIWFTPCVAKGFVYASNRKYTIYEGSEEACLQL